ncbi:serine O-acetyltransferase [Methanobrevibacter sp. TMH8]|uniref:serine O-acetyltransferase n=1 Tax=Methanobrevibacter sp. TMH8 TaxID=2848611 RepID=UPI001CCE5FBE|nr:serine O-acetyltransferase [Methanobrevibacter sp. TMH8]MBZ9570210.1 serine O-acetyltransferase [Methanobrevibacter sp. TMH8]
MFKRIKEDILMVNLRDPAARSSFEIFLCYSGLHSIWYHLFAHYLWNHGRYLSARIVSSINRFFTGIEIHPAAKIGRRVFIDHGMGVVIGETAEIGNDVILYKGVVLGGTSTIREKRHPTVGDGVVIGSGALIIGNITLGNGSKVGAGSVVLDNVPNGATIVGVPGKIVQEERKCAIDLEHQNLPDPIDKTLQMLLKRQKYLENEIIKLKQDNKS